VILGFLLSLSEKMPRICYKPPLAPPLNQATSDHKNVRGPDYIFFTSKGLSQDALSIIRGRVPSVIAGTKSLTRDSELSQRLIGLFTLIE